MTSINCENFSASDLRLFIESIEKITVLERVKQERQQQHRAQQLVETLRYFDQQYPASSSSTLSSTDDPEDECVDIEEKEILGLYAVKDLLCSFSCEEQQLECIGDDAMDETEYQQIEEEDDNTASYYDNESLLSVSSTGIYESASSISYQEPVEVNKKKSLKQRLLSLVRQHYSKHLKNNNS